jgi:hypothetical protein
MLGIFPALEKTIPKAGKDCAFDALFQYSRIPFFHERDIEQILSKNT